MKNNVNQRLLIFFSISSILGTCYFIWTKTAIGKNTLSKWLLKKWEEQAKREEKTLDLDKLAIELNKLDYADHELLALYTRMDLFEKERKGQLKGKVKERMNGYLKRMADTKILYRADLSMLDNSVLPG